MSSLPGVILSPAKFLWTAILLAGFLSSHTLSAQTPGFVTFDAPDAGTGSDEGTLAFCINQNGTIAGSYIAPGNVSHGFVRLNNGQITEFDPPNSTGTFPNAINRGGQIVGSMNRKVIHGDNIAGFLRTAAGGYVGINPPNSVDSQPFAIDDSGNIAGTYDDSAGVWHGFLRTRAGAYVTFDVPGAGTGRTQGTTPVSMNANQEIAGYYIDSNSQRHGFVRDSAGNISTFDAPGSGTQPVAINANGVVTGTYQDSQTLGHSFLRDASGNISTIDMPGAIQTFAISMNDQGIVVGDIIPPPPTPFAGFVRDATGNFFSLMPPGANGATANGINSSGRIAGYWVTGTGRAHGFVK